MIAAVAIPEPQLFTGATQQKNQKLLEASATIHTSYYSTFAAAHEKGMGEPPDAQALYAALEHADARRAHRTQP